MANPVNRVLEWYEKDPDSQLVSEEVLNQIKLEELQEIFKIEKSNPMYDCYKVENDHQLKLQKHASTLFQIDKYDYFVTLKVVTR